MDLRRLISSEHASVQLHALRLLLRLCSLPYQVAMWLRNRLYDLGIKRSHRLPVAVISVGNLSVGGTGKTPVVAWIAKYARSQGVRVAIISRGYGQLDDGRNDEALELELSLPDVPHIQNPHRVAAGQLAVEELQMQMIVLDDAFQHRRIARDLDIVLVDASDRPHVRRLLPGGLYREPLSELSRAPIVILTRTDQSTPDQLNHLEKQIQSHAPNALVVRSKHQPIGFKVFLSTDELPVGFLRNRKVLAFCGIGNPDAFFQTLADTGAIVIGRWVFPDHHPYSPNDVSRIIQWAGGFTDAEYLVCTVKDWVKLQTGRIGQLPLAALEIGLQFTSGELEFVKSLSPIIEKAISSIPDGRGDENQETDPPN